MHKFPITSAFTANRADLPQIRRAIAKADLRYVHNPIFYDDSVRLVLGGDTENFRIFDQLYNPNPLVVSKAKSSILTRVWKIFTKRRR